MKKFFTGLILSSLLFAGCMDILNQPEPVSPGTGRALVNIGGARPERTLAPSDTAALVFTRYELSFEGPAPVDPLGVTENLGLAVAVELPVGRWTIRATGYTGTAGAYTPAAEGSVEVTVNEGTNPPVNITLGPPASAGNGTFSYSITVPTGAAGSLVISPAEGGADETIPLSAGGNANPAKILAVGQYLVRVRLEKSGAWAGLTEVLHIYPGKASALPAKTYTDGDFTASVPASPAKPLITLIKSSNTQDNMTNQGGTIETSWQAVSGAAEYEVYYAPYVADPAPSIPASPAQTISAPATSAVLTAADIGNNTMNYYVWVKAKNALGTSPASPPASSLDRFYGVWMDGGGMDGFEIDSANLRYLMTWANPDGTYDIFTYIRAIVPFEKGSETVNFNGKTGAAGIIVVEYDDSVDTNTWWSHVSGKYFIAVYYYGLTGSGAGSSAYLGFAADLQGVYGEPDYGADAGSVDEAIAKFTFAGKDLYVSPAVAALYNREDQQQEGKP